MFKLITHKQWENLREELIGKDSPIFGAVEREDVSHSWSYKPQGQVLGIRLQQIERAIEGINENRKREAESMAYFQRKIIARLDLLEKLLKMTGTEEKLEITCMTHACDAVGYRLPGDFKVTNLSSGALRVYPSTKSQVGGIDRSRQGFDVGAVKVQNVPATISIDLGKGVKRVLTKHPEQGEHHEITDEAPVVKAKKKGKRK